MGAPGDSFQLSIVPLGSSAFVIVRQGAGAQAVYVYGQQPLGTRTVPPGAIAGGGFSYPGATPESFEGAASFSQTVSMGRYPFDFQGPGRRVRVMLPPTVLNVGLPATGMMRLFRAL